MLTATIGSTPTIATGTGRAGQGTRRFIRGLVDRSRNELNGLGDNEPLTKSIVISPNGRVVKQDPQNIPKGCSVLDLLLYKNGLVLAGPSFNPNLGALGVFEDTLDQYNRGIN